VDVVSGVWMVIPSFHPLIGGAEIQARRVSLALLERGWGVRVLTRRDAGMPGPRPLRNDHVDGIPVTRVGSRGPTKVASVQYLLGGIRALATEGRGNIYHAHDLGTPGLLAALGSRLFGGRSVVKLRTGASAYRLRLANSASRWLFLRLLRLHDRIIVVNSEVEHLLAAVAIPPDRVVRIPNGVDGEVFRGSSPAQRREVRTALGLPLDTTLVLYVGRLAHVKGVDILLNAWASLPQETRAASMLVVVGDGPARGGLIDLARSLGIAESVVMTGSKPDVRDFYCACDVFVLPSRTDGLSNALLEAMASELPVVATNVGGATDVVENGVSGWLAPPNDPKELMRGLQVTLARAGDWRRMGAAGRERVLKYAGLEVVVDRLERVYRDLSASDHRATELARRVPGPAAEAVR
jgi:glycosyltransferase involved in cell wall biosynthesis